MTKVTSAFVDAASRPRQQTGAVHTVLVDVTSQEEELCTRCTETPQAAVRAKCGAITSAQKFSLAIRIWLWNKKHKTIKTTYIISLVGATIVPGPAPSLTCLA